MNEKPKTKWRWRLLRWGLAGLAILATLVGVLVTEENWRAKRAWEDYQRQAAAKGDPLDRLSLATNTISDEQNFAKAPIFSGVGSIVWDEKTQGWKPGDTNLVDRLKMGTLRSDGISMPMSGDWSLARLIDLKPWQDYYRTPSTNSVAEFPTAPQPQSPAADVLLALSKYDSAIEELRLAARRPYSRFADYDAYDSKTMSRLMAYIGDIGQCCWVVQLRALAELSGGQTTNAFDDVKLLLRLYDALRQEPPFIAHLAGLATMSMTLQPVYEGLARHQWSEAQLAELERELARIVSLADYQEAMRGERAFTISSIENLRHTREYKTTVFDVGSGTNKIITVSSHLTPSAFFYQKELAFGRLHEQYCVPLVDLEKRIVRPADVHRAAAAVQEETKHYQPYRFFALWTLRADIEEVAKFASTQSSVDRAQVACALERHRLAHGDYPETLDVLVPQFIEKLPHDIINGQPLHYRRTEDGKFVLYSVGWNEIDDGGQLAYRKSWTVGPISVVYQHPSGQLAYSKSGTVDQDNGDWVWRYP